VPKQLPSNRADRPLSVAVHLRDPDRGDLLLDLQHVQLALEVPEKLWSMVVDYATGLALRSSEYLVEHAGRPGGVDTQSVVDTHVEQFARVDIDDEQRLEPAVLDGLHPEEVEGPQGVLGRRPHTVEAHLVARTRREAVIAKDPHDGRLAHTDAHPPELLPDAPLAPSRVLALERDDQLDDGIVERRSASAERALPQ
jgi:hypothetical protein